MRFLGVKCFFSLVISRSSITTSNNVQSFRVSALGRANSLKPNPYGNLVSARGGMVSAKVGDCAIFATGGVQYAQ